MPSLNQIADEIINAHERPFDTMYHARVKAIFRHEAATMVRQSIDKDGLSDHFKTRFSAAISVIDDSSILCGGDCPTLRTTNKLATPIRYKTDDPFSFVGTADGTVVYIYTKITELPYVDLSEAYQANPIRYVYQNGYIYIKDDSIDLCGSANIATGTYTPASGPSLAGYDITIIDHTFTTGDYINVIGVNDNDPTVEVLISQKYVYSVDDDTIFIESADVSIASAITWKLYSSINNVCISIEGAYPLGDVYEYTPEASLSDKVFTDDTELPLPEDLIQVIKLKLMQGELSVIDDKNKIIPEHIDTN